MSVCVCVLTSSFIYCCVSFTWEEEKKKRRENFFYLPALTTTPAHLCYCCCYLLSPVSALPHKINAPPSTLHPKCIWPYPYIPPFFSSCYFVFSFLSDPFLLCRVSPPPSIPDVTFTLSIFKKRKNVSWYNIEFLRQFHLLKEKTTEEIGCSK